MFFEEMRNLPEEIPSIEETGFYIAGFNWFANYVAIPLNVALLSILSGKADRLAGQLMEWSLKRFSKPPYRTVMLLEASGLDADRKKHMRLTISHEDGYLMTGGSGGRLPVAVFRRHS